MDTVVVDAWADKHSICSIVKIKGHTEMQKAGNYTSLTHLRKRQMKALNDALSFGASKVEPGGRLVIRVQTEMLKNWLQGRGDYSAVLSEIEAARNIINSVPGEVLITVNPKGYAKAIRHSTNQEAKDAQFISIADID